MREPGGGAYGAPGSRAAPPYAPAEMPKPTDCAVKTPLTPLSYCARAGEPGTVPVPAGTVLFVEAFAGCGRLSQAMRALGIQVAEPQDLETGGLDLRKPADLRRFREQLARWARLGYTIVLHLAIPCSTFSRARDRSHRTRVRSPTQLQGFSPLPEKVRDANLLAVSSAQTGAWVVSELGGCVSIENPAGSYLWPYLRSFGTMEGLPQLEVYLHMCRYGAAWKKPTCLLFVGRFRPSGLGRTCVTRGGRHSCGRPYHVELGFTGGARTGPAARYPRQLCRAWAVALRHWISFSKQGTSASESSSSPPCCSSGATSHAAGRHPSVKALHGAGQAERVKRKAPGKGANGGPVQAVNKEENDQ